MNKKEQEVVKTMNNIIKSKNKKVGNYSMNKLRKLTKGGGITNFNNSNINLNNLSLMSSDEFIRLAFKPDDLVNKKEMLDYLSNKYKGENINLNSLNNNKILNYLSNKFKGTNIKLNNLNINKELANLYYDKTKNNLNRFLLNYDAKLWEFFIKYGNNGDYIWNVGGDIDY